MKPRMDPSNALRAAWQPYVVAVAIVAAAAGLRLWPLEVLGARLTWLTFYPAVTVAALYGGFSAGVIATVLSCLTVLFVLPVFVGQPFIRDSADWLGVAVFFITCTMVSGVAEAMRRARAREKQASELLEAANIKLCGEIDERKHAEDERDRFFNLSLDLICIAGFDGYFKQVNSAWETTLGWTRAELLSKPYLEFIHPDDRRDTASEAGKNEGGERSVAFENRYRCKDGSYKWLSWMAMPSKEQTLIYATARDITERKRAEEMLKNYAAQLETANKELEAFSYSVSHDLRAPLRSIDGFSLALLEDYRNKLDAQGKDYLQRVRAAAQRMAELIDDMLELSRVTRAEIRRERVDLSRLAKNILEDLKKEQPEREVDLVVQEGMTAEGDSRLLRVALRNLLENAWKFTAKRPTARIEFGAMEQDGRPAHFVRDDGAGFDMTYANKLFGIFQRLHSFGEFPGTGVGLATVQRIVHRHGGKVWAEGEVGKGATFYFTL